MRYLLIAELLFGLVPVTVHYLFFFRAGLFWTGEVLSLAVEGIGDLLTAAVAVVFVGGGIGLLSGWTVLVCRLFGRRWPVRAVRPGLVAGIVAGAILLFLLAPLGASWLDYYVYGTPLAVALHQIVSPARAGPADARPRGSPVAVVILVVAIVQSPATSPASAAPVAAPGRAAEPAAPRVAAEWEPALGAMVGWPPIVPDALLVEIARDDRLYLVVGDDKERQEAEDAIKRLGIDPARAQIIVAPAGDARHWPRDWGPFPLFDEEGDFHLADPRFLDYPGSTPDCDGPLFGQKWIFFTDARPDDAATAIVAKALGVDHRQLPIALTGGNALVDGHGTVFSTCIMLNENRRWLGIEPERFRHTLETRLGLSRSIIVPNFEWFGIQHIDCLLKPLDEETLLVKRIPETHPDHRPIEAIVKILEGQTTPRGRPYRIRRIDTPPYLFGHFVANYTNSLILNRKVLVPLFGIPGDDKALATWREMMPGYKVIGFRNDGPYGWNWLDALHCRVRAVVDPGMLALDHRRPDEVVEPAENHPLEVTIRDYSRSGLIPEELKLHWRAAGESDWRTINLREGGKARTYVAAIPSPGPGKRVEYYFAAADRSGRRETLPRVAPGGFFAFTVRPSTP